MCLYLDTGLQSEEGRLSTPVGSTNQDYPTSEEEKAQQLSWASRISQATTATITKSQQPPATSQVIQQPPPASVQPQPVMCITWYLVSHDYGVTIQLNI